MARSLSEWRKHIEGLDTITLPSSQLAVQVRRLSIQDVLASGAIDSPLTAGFVKLISSLLETLANGGVEVGSDFADGDLFNSILDENQNLDLLKVAGLVNQAAESTRHLATSRKALDAFAVAVIANPDPVNDIVCGGDQLPVPLLPIEDVIYLFGVRSGLVAAENFPKDAE